MLFHFLFQSLKMTDRKLIIRACLLYEFKLGTSASSASHKLCTAFGEGEVSERTAQNWFQKFRSGNETSKMNFELDDQYLYTMAI